MNYRLVLEKLNPDRILYLLESTSPGLQLLDYDGIDEGVAKALVEAVIESDRIVLGFHPQEPRKYTGFAAD